MIQDKKNKSYISYIYVSIWFVSLLCHIYLNQITDNCFKNEELVLISPLKPNSMIATLTDNLIRYLLSYCSNLICSNLTTTWYCYLLIFLKVIILSPLIVLAYALIVIIAIHK